MRNISMITVSWFIILLFLGKLNLRWTRQRWRRWLVWTWRKQTAGVQCKTRSKISRCSYSLLLSLSLTSQLVNLKTASVFNTCHSESRQNLRCEWFLLTPCQPLTFPRSWDLAGGAILRTLLGRHQIAFVSLLLLCRFLLFFQLFLLLP